MFMGRAPARRPLRCKRRIQIQDFIMRTRSLLSRPSLRQLTALVALTLGGASAQACDIWRDEDFGIWRGTCSLAEDFRNKFVLSEAFIARFEHRIRLKLPDLHIRKFKFFVIGTSVTIEADIENLGMANVATSMLAVSVTVANPLTGMQQGQTIPFTVQVPAIAAGSSLRVSVGAINVPNNQQDWDLVLFGVTDPPPNAQATRGVLAESDEANNSHAYSCRWYGPSADTSLEPCD
jgi:hypothetical protein